MVCEPLLGNGDSVTLISESNILFPVHIYQHLHHYLFKKNYYCITNVFFWLENFDSAVMLDLLTGRVRTVHFFPASCQLYSVWLSRTIDIHCFSNTIIFSSQTFIESHELYKWIYDYKHSDKFINTYFICSIHWMSHMYNQGLLNRGKKKKNKDLLGTVGKCRASNQLVNLEYSGNNK